jgi:hypothetical protein
MKQYRRTKLKKLLEFRNVARIHMKQVNSVCSYLYDALEQAKETGFQYDIDHARDRYTKYFDTYLYKARDTQRKANLDIIKHIDNMLKF